MRSVFLFVFVFVLRHCTGGKFDCSADVRSEEEAENEQRLDSASSTLALRLLLPIPEISEDAAAALSTAFLFYFRFLLWEMFIKKTVFLVSEEQKDKTLPRKELPIPELSDDAEVPVCRRILSSFFVSYLLLFYFNFLLIFYIYFLCIFLFLFIF